MLVTSCLAATFARRSNRPEYLDWIRAGEVSDTLPNLLQASLRMVQRGWERGSWTVATTPPFVGRR
jgi:hypothetical protein